MIDWFLSCKSTTKFSNLRPVRINLNHCALYTGNHSPKHTLLYISPWMPEVQKRLLVSCQKLMLLVRASPLHSFSLGLLSVDFFSLVCNSTKGEWSSAYNPGLYICGYLVFHVSHSTWFSCLPVQIWQSIWDLINPKPLRKSCQLLCVSSDDLTLQLSMTFAVIFCPCVKSYSRKSDLFL